MFRGAKFSVPRENKKKKNILAQIKNLKNIYLILSRLDSLIDNFDKYYPKNEQIVKDDWIRDPFLARDLPAHFDHKENEELIDLVTDVSLQATFMRGTR